jgi:hypothetical protein
MSMCRPLLFRKASVSFTDSSALKQRCRMVVSAEKGWSVSRPADQSDDVIRCISYPSQSSAK